MYYVQSGPSNVSYLAPLVTSYLCQLQDSTSVLSYKNCFKWSLNMTLITVQTVCTTFLSEDGMIFGNVGISPMPSSCLTHNNAQRRFGFDRISPIAQRYDLPVFIPLDLLKVRKSRKQIMVSSTNNFFFRFFGRIENIAFKIRDHSSITSSCF